MSTTSEEYCYTTRVCPSGYGAFFMPFSSGRVPDGVVQPPASNGNCSSDQTTVYKDGSLDGMCLPAGITFTYPICPPDTTLLDGVCRYNDQSVACKGFMYKASKYHGSMGAKLSAA